MAGRPKVGGFTRLIAPPRDSADAVLIAQRAARRTRRAALLARVCDIRNLDIFGYHPVYTFPGYRSQMGSWMSLILATAVMLRVVSSWADFVDAEPTIAENVLVFPRDMHTPFELPKFGLIFKRTGWQPFYDPNYFTFSFQQGVAGHASNSSYVDLGDAPCSFVDPHGRIIEDEARCPSSQVTLLERSIPCREIPTVGIPISAPVPSGQLGPEGSRLRTGGKGRAVGGGGGGWWAASRASLPSLARRALIGQPQPRSPSTACARGSRMFSQTSSTSSSASCGCLCCAAITEPMPRAGQRLPDMAGCSPLHAAARLMPQPASCRSPPHAAACLMPQPASCCSPPHATAWLMPQPASCTSLLHLPPAPHRLHLIACLCPWCRPQPGSCRTPEEIDKLIYEGTLTLGVAQV